MMISYFDIIAGDCGTVAVSGTWNPGPHHRRLRDLHFNVVAFSCDTRRIWRRRYETDGCFRIFPGNGRHRMCDVFGLLTGGGYGAVMLAKKRLKATIILHLARFWHLDWHSLFSSENGS